MRFLLLCPAALLLLAAPAIADSPDSPDSSELSDSNTTPTSEPTTTLDITTPPGSDESDAEEQPSPIYESDSLEVKKLRKEVAEAQAELKTLAEENAALQKTSESIQYNVSMLGTKESQLAIELVATKEKLQKVQDELKAEQSKEAKCKPSESELLKLIEEQTEKLVNLRKAAIKRSYEKKYDNLLKDLRSKIRRELQLLTDRSNKIPPRVLKQYNISLNLEG